MKFPFELEDALYVVLYGPDIAHLSELDSCFALYVSFEILVCVQTW